MKASRYVPCLVLLALACALAACGGTKRPPAVRSNPPSGSGSSGTAGRSQPVEAPDLKPLGEPGVGSGDFVTSDPSGEGGPLEDVLFEYDKAALNEAARALLERHAVWLQTHREARVIVEGHCDERGTVEYNLALGDKRAQAARDYLVSLGVSSDRLRAASFGKERPVDPGHTEEAWAKNRRAHFNVAR